MQIKKNKIVAFLTTAIAGSVCFLSVNCNNEQTRLDEGKALSKQYCQVCHKYPDPGLLDKATWLKQTLPAMAPHLGIEKNGLNVYATNALPVVKVTDEEWQKIVDYYESAAPKALKPAKPPVPVTNGWAIFKAVKPLDSITTASTTMVAYDSINHQIYTGDMMARTVTQWSSKLKTLKSFRPHSPAVDAQFSKDTKGVSHATFTFIGSLNPTDDKNGTVKEIDPTIPEDDFIGKATTIATTLPRPVQSRSADFDKDGLKDWVICGFGHNIGGLYLYKQLPDNKYQQKIISTLPGAENVVIDDFNHDGWPDIMCLFAQAQEGIWMFLNDHKGGFTSTNILYFPPVYGSSSFQLVDFNHDGKPDILYTAGDNGDYSSILKPYHGIYIFINQGNYKFKQTYFYPVNGATKAVAADFNGDGKLDIALVSFFADLKGNANQGFTYFEQQDNLKFKPYQLPIGNLGRWICMDVCDYNSDGKPDVILGNFSFGYSNQTESARSWNTHYPFIVLENTSKKK